MNDRSGQDVGTIVSHNIPKIRVDPTVENDKSASDADRTEGVFWNLQTIRFPNGDWYSSGQNEGNALQNPVLERVLLRTEEVAGLVVGVDLVGVV